MTTKVFFDGFGLGRGGSFPRGPRRLNFRGIVSRGVIGVTLFNVSSHDSNFGNGSSSVVIVDVGARAGTVGLISVIHSALIPVRRGKGAGCGGVGSYCRAKPRLTVGAVGGGFNLSVSRCTAMGFSNVTGVVSTINKVSTRLITNRIIPMRGDVCVLGNYVTSVYSHAKRGPRGFCVAGPNGCRLGNIRTITCSQVHGARGI